MVPTTNASNSKEGLITMAEEVRNVFIKRVEI